MTLHVESIVSVLRWYRGADGFHVHAPFDVAGVMLQLTRDSVFVLALNGRMSRQYRAELRDWCAAHDPIVILRRDFRHISANGKATHRTSYIAPGPPLTGGSVCAENH